MLRVREPVARPLDVVAAEVGVTISQALLCGLLAHLATGFWLERGVATGSVVAIFTIAAVAVAGSWLYWLLGGEGWPMAVVCLPVGLVLGFALVLAWRGSQFGDLAVDVTLLAVMCTVYGVAAGVFLDSPRRWRWDQRRQPRPDATVPRLSPAGERMAHAVRVGVHVPLATRRPARPPAPLAPGPDAGKAPAQARPEAPPEETPHPVVRMATPRPVTTQERARRPQASFMSVAPGSPAAIPGTAAADDASAPSVPGPGTSPPPSTALETPSEPRPVVDLPTTGEPRARRSPWAWASPPEWSRDDLDEDVMVEPHADR